jgi:hypothetical protein
MELIMDVATLDIEKLPNSQRLKIIREMQAEVVRGIRSAQDALRECDEPTNTVCIVVAALGRLGWIAEQCSVMAGCKFTPVVGGADAWLLGLSARDALADLMAGLGDSHAH